jgi:predicted RNA-binding Zn-ribbon protein involved in translation (DUF1610 family)
MWSRCPGVRELIRPSIIIRTCPACGGEVEFFSDETEAKCPNCGRILYREATASCVTWCEYALKCIADLEERKLITQDRAEELRARIGKKT